MYTDTKRKVSEMSKKKSLSFNQFIERFSTEESCSKYCTRSNGPMVMSAPSVGAAMVMRSGDMDGTSVLSAGTRPLSPQVP
jgi:hypothetical protein